MKRFMKDKRGSSLVMVLITMTFLSILGVTVITMTINNIRLKSAQKFNESNFYDSESVVNMIKTGLDNDCSEISTKAYESAMNGYNKVVDGSNKADSISDQYKYDYLVDVAFKLADKPAEVTNEEDFAKMFFYVNQKKSDGYKTGIIKDSNLKYSDGALRKYISSEKQQDYYIDHSSSDGADKVNNIIVDMDKGYLVLKNIRVRHASEKDFETYIKTDIKIKVPDSDMNVKSEYLAYSLIADNQVIANHVNNVEVKGNVYAGTVNRETKTADASFKSSRNGIVVDDGANVSMALDQLITRGNISVSGKSSLSIQPSDPDTESNVWCENISTEKKENSSGGNTLTIGGSGTNNMETYVADDLTVNGNSDKVTLGGKYFGYSFADVNKLDSSLTSDKSEYELDKAGGNKAEFNSSIAINGTGVNFDITGLQELLLAGTSYIDKTLNTGEDLPGGDPGDIKLPESLSPKASQIAYYIPGSYIGETPDDENDKVISEDPKRYFHITKYSENYLGFSAVPYYKEVKVYRRNDTKVKSDLLYYYFIVDTSKDNKMEEGQHFFQRFIGSEKQKKNFDSLSKSFGTISNNGNTLISASGNVYTSLNNGETKITGGILDPQVSASTANQFIKTFNHEYTSRQMSLLSDYSGAPKSEYRLKDTWEGSDTKDSPNKIGKDSGTNLFNVLVSGTLNETSSKDEKEVNPDVKGFYYTTNGSVNIGGSVPNSIDSNSGIVVAAGDVNVYSSFNGLIIAGGNINIEGDNVTLTADAESADMIISSSPYLSDLFSDYFRKSTGTTIKNGTGNDGSTVQTINWQLNPAD